MFIEFKLQFSDPDSFENDYYAIQEKKNGWEHFKE